MHIGLVVHNVFPIILLYIVMIYCIAFALMRYLYMASELLYCFDFSINDKPYQMVTPKTASHL
jgi:hypothetical protein